MRIAHWPALISMIIGTAILMVPTAAEAGSSVHCRGFTQCKARGYTNAGYSTHRLTSWWNMTPGTNCANYVAFRLTHGRLVARPPGTDAARTWGAAARAKGIPVVRTTPRRGDVAWWDANQGLAGKKGHVAYVERVKADGSVVVSEDNFESTFMWRTVRRGSGWPTGFIRYPASDGSPYGDIGEVSQTGGVLSLKGSSSEPDRWGRQVGYLVTVGAPRDEDPAETFTFSTSYYRFSRLKTLATRGPTTVYLYGLNTAGTNGTDTLLGSAEVTLTD